MAEKKGNYMERRKDLLNYLNAAGCFGVSSQVIRTLSEKFQVSERQIYKDLEIVIKKVSFPEVEKLSKKFFLSFEIAMKASHRLIISQDPNIQTKGITLLNQTISNFTNFLERFGLKEKIKDERQVDGLAGTFNLITKSVEEIKNERNKDTRRETDADSELEGYSDGF
jgi:hypothetical protein